MREYDSIGVHYGDLSTHGADGGQPMAESVSVDSGCSDTLPQPGNNGEQGMLGDNHSIKDTWTLK